MTRIKTKQIVLKIKLLKLKMESLQLSWKEYMTIIRYQILVRQTFGDKNLIARTRSEQRFCFRVETQNKIKGVLNKLSE